jgi:hypothetical protein
VLALASTIFANFSLLAGEKKFSSMESEREKEKKFFFVRKGKIDSDDERE